MSGDVRTNLALALILASIQGRTTLADLTGADLEANSELRDITIDGALDLLGFDTAGQAIEGLLAQATPRDALILQRRVLRLTNLARQEEIAREIGLTRQRVHQIEGPVKARWWAAAEVDESLHAYARAWRLGLADAVPAHDLAAHYGDSGEAVVVTLSPMSGRSTIDEWSVADSALPAWDTLSKQLANAADDQAYVELEQVVEWAGDLKVASAHLRQRATEFGAEEFLGGLLFKPTRRTRALAALRLSDRPLTAEEVAELSGASESYVGNILAEADEVVRADKQRWWMRELVADPYEGIVQEIRQRIEAGGGVASVERLLQELPETFGVAESSVRSYVYGKLFTVDGDQVRECDEYRFEPKDPRLLKNVRRTAAGWAERIVVKDDHLRGYSLALSPHVCFANGVRPSDSLRVPIEGTADEASIIWNTANTTGRVDVGRLRTTLLARGVEAEMPIWLAAGRDGVSVMLDDTISENDPQAHVASLEDLKELVGIDDDEELPANPLLARLRARRT